LRAPGEDGGGHRAENRRTPPWTFEGARESEKGEEMVFADTTFLDVFWWMIVMFFWVMAIWIFIALIGDIFRRDDLSGWGKAGWIILLVCLPFIGALAYIIARPKMTASDVRMMTQAEAAQRAVAGVSTADELSKLSQLRTEGVLSEQEYEALKRKALATA
jgi:flagellar biosynthesis/type III secretory pathway M-ring protein FliF/YscJ